MPHGPVEFMLYDMRGHVHATLQARDGIARALTFLPDLASLGVIRCSAVAPLNAFVAEHCIGRGEIVGHSGSWLGRLLGISGGSHCWLD